MDVTSSKPIGDEISAAKAHIAVQEALAKHASGEGFEGSVTEDPTQDYPANMHFVVEVAAPATEGRPPKRMESSWRYGGERPVTVERITTDVATAVEAVRTMREQAEAEAASDAEA